MIHPRSSGGGHPGGLLGAVMGGPPPRTSPWLEVGGLILSALGDAQTGGDTDYLGSVLKMQNRMREREASAWELQERLRLAEFARQQEHAALESMNGDGPASNTGLPQPDSGPFSPVPAAYQQHPVENYIPPVVGQPGPDSGLFSPMPAAYLQPPGQNYIPPVVGQPGPESGLFSPMPQNPSPYMQLYNAYRLPGHVHHGHGQTGQRHMPAPPNLPGLLTIMRDATTEDDLMRMRAVLENMNGDGPASNTGLPQPDSGPFSPVPAAYQQHPVENYPPSIVRLPQPDSGLFSPMPAAYQQIPGQNYIPPAVEQPVPDGERLDESNRGTILDPFAHGLTMGSHDEIYGFLRGLSAVLAGGDFSEAYALGRDEMRANLAAYRERNPNAAFAGEMLGSVPMLFIPGGAIVRGASAAGRFTPVLRAAATSAAPAAARVAPALSAAARTAAPVTARFTPALDAAARTAAPVLSWSGPVLRSAAPGARSGAIQGFASGEGGFGERVANAGWGAAEGGATGAVGTMAANRITPLFSDRVRRTPFFRGAETVGQHAAEQALTHYANEIVRMLATPPNDVPHRSAMYSAQNRH